MRGQELARRLIESGIRARMLSQSLLTGQKYIELDFLPNEKARFAGLSRRYPELPTTTSSMEKLSQKGEELVDKLAALPVDQMLEDLRQALRQPAHAPRLARPQGRDRGSAAVDGRAAVRRSTTPARRSPSCAG